MGNKFVGLTFVFVISISLLVSANSMSLVEYHVGGPITNISSIDGDMILASDLTVEWWGVVTNTEDITVSKLITTGESSTNHTNTNTQDDTHDRTDEVRTGGGGRKYRLNITYTINIDPSGTGPYTLYLDAYTSSEEMAISYSVNGGAIESAGSVTMPSDTDAYTSALLTGVAPGDIVDVTFIDTVVDGTDKTWADSILIDHMYILGGNPNVPTDHNTLNWTLDGDDGAGADNILQYNIYRSIDPDGPWDAGSLIDSVPAGTDTYTDFFMGIPDGIQWWYVVRAEDIIGNEDANTNSVPEPIYIPDSAPVSSASYTGASPTSANTVMIDWSATDDIYLTQIELFYQFDGSGYASWEDANDPAMIAGTVASGSWSFDFPDGPGTYDIYTMASDNSPQTEAAPGTPDVTIIYATAHVYDIDLIGASDKQWVFVSFPTDITGDVLTVIDDAAWGDGGTTWNMIHWYDPTDPIDHWKSYSIAQATAGIPQDMPNVDNKMGLWVRIINAGGGADDPFLTVGEGFEPSGTSIQLQAGWNMVGFPSQTEGYTAGDLKADSGGLVTSVERFNDAAAYHMEIMPDVDEFQIGQAYWVYSTGVYTWIIP